MATMNTADIGFEKEIWRAADKMRGNIDASEYKSVVLGLIFLKYISDKFETKYRQLVDEGEDFEEDKDEYTAENIFYVPAEARWETIAAQAHTPEIGTAIDNAMRASDRDGLPARLGGDVEDVLGGVFVLVLLEVLALVDELAVFGLELVGNVFQEDQTQHDGLVFRRVDIAAHLVRRAPDLLLEADIGRIHGCHR